MKKKKSLKQKIKKINDINKYHLIVNLTNTEISYLHMQYIYTLIILQYPNFCYIYIYN